MATVEYEKIVRTKIPEIIKQKGSEPLSFELPGKAENTLVKFHKKFKEEIKELTDARAEDEILDEAADVYQVLLDYLSLWNYQKEDLEVARNAKEIKRGTFLNPQGMVTYLSKVDNP